MRKFVTGILAVATVWMFMRATEMRILIQQEIVLGAAGESLVCRYLTEGERRRACSGIRRAISWGRSRCALVHTDRHSLRRQGWHVPSEVRLPRRPCAWRHDDRESLPMPSCRAALVISFL